MEDKVDKSKKKIAAKRSNATVTTTKNEPHGMNPKTQPIVEHANISSRKRNYVSLIENNLTENRSLNSKKRCQIQTGSEQSSSQNKKSLGLIVLENEPLKTKKVQCQENKPSITQSSADEATQNQEKIDKIVSTTAINEFDTNVVRLTRSKTAFNRIKNEPYEMNPETQSKVKKAKIPLKKRDNASLVEEKLTENRSTNLKKKCSMKPDGEQTNNQNKKSLGSIVLENEPLKTKKVQRQENKPSLTQSSAAETTQNKKKIDKVVSTPAINECDTNGIRLTRSKTAFNRTKNEPYEMNPETQSKVKSANIRPKKRDNASLVKDKLTENRSTNLKKKGSMKTDGEQSSSKNTKSLGVRVPRNELSKTKKVRCQENKPPSTQSSAAETTQNQKQIDKAVSTSAKTAFNITKHEPYEINPEIRSKAKKKKQVRREPNKKSLKPTTRCRLDNEFIINEVVLATIQGYAPWPAYIINIEGGTYTVRFFGTGETNPVRFNSLSRFELDRAIPLIERRGYKKAIMELEMVLKVPKPVSLFR